jgi:hypothetical protein
MRLFRRHICQGSDWYYSSVSLTSKVITHARFKATTGLGSAGDIAIDDV